MAFEKFGALERTDLEAMPLEELYKLVSNRFKTVLGAQATPEEMETTAEKTADVLPETTGNVPAQGDVETVGEQGLEASGLAAGTEETLESEYTNLPSPDARVLAAREALKNQKRLLAERKNIPEAVG